MNAINDAKSHLLEKVQQCLAVGDIKTNLSLAKHTLEIQQGFSVENINLLNSKVPVFANFEAPLLHPEFEQLLGSGASLSLVRQYSGTFSPRIATNDAETDEPFDVLLTENQDKLYFFEPDYLNNNLYIKVNLNGTVSLIEWSMELNNSFAQVAELLPHKTDMHLLEESRDLLSKFDSESKTLIEDAYKAVLEQLEEKLQQAKVVYSCEEFFAHDDEVMVLGSLDVFLTPENFLYHTNTNLFLKVDEFGALSVSSLDTDKAPWRVGSDDSLIDEGFMSLLIQRLDTDNTKFHEALINGLHPEDVVYIVETRQAETEKDQQNKQECA